MNKNDVAPVIVTLALCVTIAGTILLFPVMRHLGRLLEAMTKERREQPDSSREITHLRDLLESLGSRLTLLEERQDFQDRLLSNGERGRAAARITEGAAAPVNGWGHEVQG
jgi:uncharacterized membrane protein YccC